MAITIERITNGKWRQNCYLVYNEHRDAVIVDAGGEADRIIQRVESNKLSVYAILTTHAHHDHIGAVNAIQVALPAPFYLHTRDVGVLQHANLFRKLFDGDPPIPLPQVNLYFDQVETPIVLGSLSVDVLFTPGHTPGGVCFLVGDHLFTGDTLLKGEIGRVDVMGGDRATLCRSLSDLAQLPSGVEIYPGHGDKSTVGDELRQNSHLLSAIR